MHDLLQQMKDMHGEYHVPDHCEGYFQVAKQWAAKNTGWKTDEVKIEEYFNNLADDKARKDALSTLMDITMNPHDIFDVLAKHIDSADNLLNIVLDKPPGTDHGSKTDKDTKINDARKKFKTYLPSAKKADLKKILEQLWSEGITPKVVFKDLVLQFKIRNEMKAWLKPS
jgi:hypothetical protein